MSNGNDATENDISNSLPDLRTAENDVLASFSDLCIAGSKLINPEQGYAEPSEKTFEKCFQTFFEECILKCAAYLDVYQYANLLENKYLNNFVTQLKKCYTNLGNPREVFDYLSVIDTIQGDLIYRRTRREKNASKRSEQDLNDEARRDKALEHLIPEIRKKYLESEKMRVHEMMTERKKGRH